jgi:ABC-type molybdate transport system substrate-binding protein
VYPAAVISAGRNREAAVRMLAWLRGAEAAAIFRAAGFIPIGR